MQKRPTKHQLRQQLEQELQSFLQQGGNIQEMPSGATGLINGRYSSLSFDKPKAERTDVSELLNTIDERKEQQKQTRNPATQRAKTPKKKVIYDDFGDPVRVVWE